jgi:hypothetical protein
MLLVVVLLTSLLAAAATAGYLISIETRSTAMVTTQRRALFCAEAGLAAARDVMLAGHASWDSVLDGAAGNDPAWYPVRGRTDGADVGPPDFEVTLRDNDDEVAPFADDPTHDNDLRVFMVSRCLRHTDTPRTVIELIEDRITGEAYRSQGGRGALNTGNGN